MEPKIGVTNNAFKITLPNRNAAAKEGFRHDHAHKTSEEQIMDFIQTNGHIVCSDVDALFDVRQPTANRILKRMVAARLIYQEGSRRKT